MLMFMRVKTTVNPLTKPTNTKVTLLPLHFKNLKIFIFL